MAKKAMVRPLTRRWLRGPAWLNGDSILVDYRRAVAYDPLSEPKVGLELSSVRSATDALAFAKRFGLLQFGAEGLDIIRGVHVGRESVQDFTRAAEVLRRIAETVLDVRRADKGDIDALSRLRSRFVASASHTPTRRALTVKDWHPPDEQIANPADDRALLIHASQWAGWQLSIGLKETRSFIFDRADRGELVSPGHLRVGILPRTLKDVCHLTIAFALADKEPLAICPECKRVFVVEDARQKFCAPTCASRARFRRFQENRSPTAKGGVHGQPTRTRRR